MYKLKYVCKLTFHFNFRVSIKFIDRDGDEITVNAKVGDTLLDVAKDNDVDLEGIFQITTERKWIALLTHFVLHFFYCKK